MMLCAGDIHRIGPSPSLLFVLSPGLSPTDQPLLSLHHPGRAPLKRHSTGHCTHVLGLLPFALQGHHGGCISTLTPVSLLYNAS